MDFGLFKKVVDELAELHVSNIDLNFGGESLLHPEFKAMLNYVLSKKQSFQSVGWITNGMLFSEDIANLVVASKLDWVTFSLDGLKELNDEIRKGSKYSLIEKNLLYLLDKRGTKIKPQISVNLTRTIQTNSYIDRFVNYWVDKVDRVVENPCFTKELQYTDLKGFHTNKIGYCGYPFSSMIIYWNGNVAPCCYDINGGNLMGNVVHDSIKKVWLNNNYRIMRCCCTKYGYYPRNICLRCHLWCYPNLPVVHTRLQG